MGTHELLEKIYELSFSDRAKLLQLWFIRHGCALLDPGEILNAIVEIDDDSSKEREENPYAIIRIQRAVRVHIEVIDILASVRSSAALIGHPAILCAIQRWEKIILYYRVLLQKDVDDRNGLMKAFKNHFSDRYVEIAKRNLKKIGEELLAGAKSRAVPMETALELKIKELGVEKTNTFLYRAWELLGTSRVKDAVEVEDKLEVIEDYLRSIDPTPVGRLGENGQLDTEFRPNAEIGLDTSISIERVIDFLRGDGRKFLEEKITEKGERVRD